MTKNKDLKRLVRARMKKTGESYTAARTHITATTKPKAAPAKAASHAELGGKSDVVMKEKTGRTWAEWLDTLDAIGGAEMTHTELARHVHGEHGVPGWWAQTVTVGYERIRGLRAKNQRRGGLFEGSKSKTFAASASAMFAAFAQKRRRDRWLGRVALVIRASKKNESMRITWPDATNVEVFFAAKGRAKSTVTIVHKKLASADAVTRSKVFWAERLTALAESIG